MTTHEIREVKNFLKQERRVVMVPIQIQHWQLRDMLKPCKEGFIFCLGRTIQQFNELTLETKVIICDIGFVASSLAFDHDIIACGGQKGNLFVFANGNEISGNTGGSINNAVQIYKNGDRHRVLLCNNDATIKIYGVEEQNLIKIIDFTVPINNCCISPNNKYMVSVCDTSAVFVHTVNGDEFTDLKLLRTVKDAGFKISWDSKSTMFAISTQDGYVSIFGEEPYHNIFNIASKQLGSSEGAVRTVNFSSKLCYDLLLFTEHNTYFTLVDARDFRKQQAVAIDSKANEIVINGAAFSYDGKRIYIGTEHYVCIYTIESSSRRCSYEKEFI